MTVREKVLGERRTGEMVTEVYIDEVTGEETARTVELIEKTVEHEGGQPPTMTSFYSTSHPFLSRPHIFH